MELTLTRPDDWHVHLRDAAALTAVARDTARCFARGIVMPNLKPPVTTVEQARSYRDRVLAVLPENADFQPLMTLYLTDATPPEEIRRARASGFIQGVKLYPAGATTNSSAGVTDLARTEPALQAMQEEGLPLLVHGEVTDPEVDVFDREAVFIDRVLFPLMGHYQDLRVVLEHVTTRQGVDFVRAHRGRVGATITAHHLLINRNAIFSGGIRPHHYCLPVAKREVHRRALLEVVAEGDPAFFLGTDSAPHGRRDKESACGCAGIYTAHTALELYAEAFEAVDALDRLEAFAGFHGADFYGLPRNTGRVILRREPWRVPESLPFGEDVLIPFRAGESLAWRCQAQ